jgi:hypothetical protein
MVGLEKNGETKKIEIFEPDSTEYEATMMTKLKDSNSKKFRPL